MGDFLKKAYDNDMKCPFCGQELIPQTIGGEWLECWNCSYHEPSHHPFPQRELCGTKELWQELIRTRKALELAITGLKNCKTREHIGAVCRTPEYVDKILEQITALEQKD